MKVLEAPVPTDSFPSGLTLPGGVRTKCFVGDSGTLRGCRFSAISRVTETRLIPGTLQGPRACSAAIGFMQARHPQSRRELSVSFAAVGRVRSDRSQVSPLHAWDTVRASGRPPSQ